MQPPRHTCEHACAGPSNLALLALYKEKEKRGPRWPQPQRALCAALRPVPRPVPQSGPHPSAQPAPRGRASSSGGRRAALAEAAARRCAALAHAVASCWAGPAKPLLGLAQSGVSGGVSRGVSGGVSGGVSRGGGRGRRTLPGGRAEPQCVGVLRVPLRHRNGALPGERFCQRHRIEPAVLQHRAQCVKSGPKRAFSAMRGNVDAGVRVVPTVLFVSLRVSAGYEYPPRPKIPAGTSITQQRLQVHK